MLGIGGRSLDPRLALHRLAGDDDVAARAILAGVDIIIAATGYRPHALPLYGRDAGEIALACQQSGGALVDRHCRVLDAHGQVGHGAFGIGLTAGFVPWGALGGEPSFRGAANGLWLWQNNVGNMIVDHLLTPRRRVAVA